MTEFASVLGLDNCYVIVYNTRNDEGPQVPRLWQDVRGAAQDGAVLLGRLPAARLPNQEAKEMKKYRKPEADPENIRHGCWVCDVDCGIGEAGKVAWAEHAKGDQHFENVRDQQYQSARNMGMLS